MWGRGCAGLGGQFNPATGSRRSALLIELTYVVTRCSQYIPSLAQAEIVDEWVGLRPERKYSKYVWKWKLYQVGLWWYTITDTEAKGWFVGDCNEYSSVPRLK